MSNIGDCSDELAQPRVMTGAGLVVLAIIAASFCCMTARPAVSARNADGAVDDEGTSQAAARPTFVGIVTTASGIPVGDARVSLVVPSGKLGDLEMATASVQSRADGSFRLQAPGPVNLRDANIQIMVESRGCAIDVARVLPQLGETRPGDIQVPPIKLNPSAEVRVRFVGPDGNPVPALKVVPHTVFSRGDFVTPSWLSIPPDARERMARRTDDNGECTLTGLPHQSSVQLHVEDDRFAQLTYQNRVPIGHEKTTVADPIALTPAASVTGRVVYGDTGKPVVGTSVFAQPVDGSHGWGMAVTDDHGEYRIKQLQAGSYNLMMRLPPDLEKSWAAAAIERVTATAGHPSEGRDFRLTKGSLITGKVVLGDTGQGVPGIRVGLHGPARPRSSAAIQSTSTSPDGTFSFRTPPGAQYVYISDQSPDGYLRKGVQSEPNVADGQTVAVILELPRDPSPPVAGRVIGADGKPVAGTRVTAVPPQGVGINTRSVLTDKDGRFQFLAIPAGSRVHTQKDEMAATATTAGQEDDLTLRLAPVPRASLLVTVVDQAQQPVKGAWVRLGVQIGVGGTLSSDSQWLTDSAGRHVIERLPVDGNYNLWIEADGYGVSQAPVKPLTPGQQNIADPVVLIKADKLIAGQVVDKDGKPKAGIKLEINRYDTGYRTTTTDTTGHFQFHVVPGATPVIWLRNENGENLRGRLATAGEENLKLVYDPADVLKPQ